MKSFSSAFSLSAFLAAAAAAHAQPAPAATLAVTPELLDRLVAEAQRQNPALLAAASREQASQAAASAVRTWEDPTASFGLWTSGFGGMKASEEGNLIYGLDQKLPLHGRPDLMRKAAAADADRAQDENDFEVRRLRRDLADALFDLALASQEADLAHDDAHWLEAVVSTVDHRYRVGQASQVEWLKAQTAKAMADDALITKGQMREHSTFAVNRLLNRDPHEEWPRIALPPLSPPLYYTPALVETALASDAQLQAMRHVSAAAQAAADLTRSNRLPDVSVGLQAWQYTGDGALKQAMATVSFTVPWLNRTKYDSDWTRDQERHRAAAMAAEDYALSLRDELHHHIVDLGAARRQAVLYQDELIPLAEQTLASAQAAWEHGLGPFQDILDAHRLLVANRVALDEALAQQAGFFDDLCLLTGRRDAAALVALAGSSEAEGQTHHHSLTP